MLLQLGAPCRKPSINAASRAPVLNAAAPVLLLAEGLGNKPAVPPPAQGCQWGPTHTSKAGELLPALLPNISELGVRPVPAPQARLQPRGCVITELQVAETPVWHTWQTNSTGLIQQVKIMLLLRLAKEWEGPVGWHSA